MSRNSNSLYSKWTKNRLAGAQWYIVSPSGTAQYADLGGMFPVDSEDGIPHVYTTVAAVFAQSNAIVSGRGDRIFLTPDYTTALTAADLLSAETNGVQIIPLTVDADLGHCVAYRDTATLPQGTTGALFTVTGRVKLVGIVGTVTTAIQNQANNAKLTLDPDAAGLASVDLCATLDITNDAVGVPYSITGTFADALVGASKGAAVTQAVPVTLEAGSLLLDCSASSTGSVKWAAFFIPLDPGARMIAA